MTANEIRNNIRYNENLIDQFYAEKAEIEKKIEELECLRAKFTTLQDHFGSKQEQRKQGLARFSQTTISNKIVPVYLEGMRGLLTGAEFNNAFQGLSTAKGKINQKIQELLQELHNCESSIDYRTGRKLYWQEQLRLALAKEVG